MQIVFAVAVLGALGLLFGLMLSAAGKLFYVKVDPRVEEVKAALAGANCGACGYPGCDACAEAVVKGEANANCCPPGGEGTAKAIAQIMGVDAAGIDPVVARVMCQGSIGIATDRYIYDGYKSCRVAAGIAGGPKECRFSCIGLGDCVDHCAFGAINMRGGVANIDEKRCKACGACVDACPRGVIRMMPVSSKVIVRCRNEDAAKRAHDSCMRACIGCGRCAKQCQYGAVQVVNGFAQIDPEKCTLCGECVKVCPRKCITM